MSAPTLILLIGTWDSAETALLNTPVLLWALSIFGTALRLWPSLALLAGALAALQWVGTYAVLYLAEGPFTEPVLQLQPILERGVLLLACGALASFLGRTFQALTAQVSVAALERERIRRALGVYVAEPIAERALAGDLELRTERRAITVMFVDIRGFTRFSEGKEPGEVLARLNQALEAFSAEVQREEGLVNKFLGDGLMAIFGAPIDQQDHALRAVRAAEAIVRAARRLSSSGAYPELRIGVGLHCGEVVVGDVGGPGHREYTAIGDVVNVASRVESQTREQHVEVLLTDAVRTHLGTDPRLGEPFPVELRGRSQPVMVTELRVLTTISRDALRR